MHKHLKRLTRYRLAKQRERYGYYEMATKPNDPFGGLVLVSAGLGRPTRYPAHMYGGGRCSAGRRVFVWRGRPGCRTRIFGATERIDQQKGGVRAYVSTPLNGRGLGKRFDFAQRAGAWQAFRLRSTSRSLGAHDEAESPLSEVETRASSAVETAFGERSRTTYNNRPTILQSALRTPSVTATGACLACLAILP